MERRAKRKQSGKFISKLLLGVTLDPLLSAVFSIGALLFALCFFSEAQQPGRIYRIGYLDPSTRFGHCWST